MTNFLSVGDCGDAEDPGIVNETSETSISSNECVYTSGLLNKLGAEVRFGS